MGKELVLIVAVATALSGCGKKDMPPAPAAPAASKSVEDVLVPKDGQPPAPPPAAAPGSSPTADAAPSAVIAGASGRPGEPMNPREVKAAMDKYFDRVGTFANSWDKLIKAGLIKSVPLDIHGKPLVFSECMEWFASGK